MNNPVFLSQSAHFFSAIAIVMIASYFWGKKGCVLAVSAFTLVIAIKEFWYDLAYELPKQTFGDSALDYLFYLIGLTVAACLVLLIKKK
jgi:hypothetical protein